MLMLMMQWPHVRSLHCDPISSSCMLQHMHTIAPEIGDEPSYAGPSLTHLIDEDNGRRLFPCQAEQVADKLLALAQPFGDLQVQVTRQASCLGSQSSIRPRHCSHQGHTAAAGSTTQVLKGRLECYQQVPCRVCGPSLQY